MQVFPNANPYVEHQETTRASEPQRDSTWFPFCFQGFSTPLWPGILIQDEITLHSTLYTPLNIAVISTAFCPENINIT